MSCLACLWYHTHPLAAIACYRKDDEKPLARGVVRGPVLLPSSSPATSPTSDTVFRRGRAGRSGRPKVLAAVQRQKARHRDRPTGSARRPRGSPASPERRRRTRKGRYRGLAPREAVSRVMADPVHITLALSVGPLWPSHKERQGPAPAVPDRPRSLRNPSTQSDFAELAPMIRGCHTRAGSPRKRSASQLP
jgi:hypothetical protein